MDRSLSSFSSSDTLKASRRIGLIAVHLRLARGRHRLRAALNWLCHRHCLLGDPHDPARVSSELAANPRQRSPAPAPRSSTTETRASGAQRLQAIIAMRTSV
jgi:hypothetical protein